MGTRSEVMGKVTGFIPCKPRRDGSLFDAVIRLDDPITAIGTPVSSTNGGGAKELTTGSTLVLSLRYSGATWSDLETVGVELCDFEPSDGEYEQREKGVWVESHANYERLVEDRRRRT